MIKGINISEAIEYSHELKEKFNITHIEQMKSQIKDKQLNIIIGTCESNEDVIRLSNMNKINIGLMRYKIEKLERKIKVIICYKCGKPNHTAENCRNQAKCIRCSSLEHTSKDCPAKDNREQYRCPNCPGKHPATYAGCPEFKRAIINKTHIQID